MQDSGPQIHLNTHFRFTIEYDETPDHKYRIVGVLVDPESRKAKLDAAGQPDTCSDSTAEHVVLIEVPLGFNTVYTYSVHWMPSNVPWESRWDRYQIARHQKIRWQPFIYSTVLCLGLLIVANTTLFHVVRKGIAQHNGTHVRDENGWKFVHGDVFRAPPFRTLLSAFLGSAVQLLFFGIVPLLILLGVLETTSVVLPILLLSFLSFGGGYVSARAYETFGGKAKSLNLILIPILVPGVAFCLLFLLNILLLYISSPATISFDIHKWPWTSFFIAGSCTFYGSAYSLVTRLWSNSQHGLGSTCVYISYSLLGSFLTFILFGSIGYAATFFFLRHIYGSIKVD